MECVQYLARQGIPFLGSNDNTNNFHQLLLLIGKYDQIILDRIQDTFVKRKHKYTHTDYQLELMTMMSNQVLKSVLTPVRENGIHSLMSDEWTDIANLEQMSICVRTVNDDPEVSENFLGFYEILNIENDTIVTAIKDALIRMQLPLSNCRGQTYESELLQEYSRKYQKPYQHIAMHILSIKSTCQNVKIDDDDGMEAIVEIIMCSC